MDAKTLVGKGSRIASGATNVTGHWAGVWEKSIWFPFGTWCNKEM